MLQLKPPSTATRPLSEPDLLPSEPEPHPLPWAACHYTRNSYSEESPPKNPHFTSHPGSRQLPSSLQEAPLTSGQCHPQGACIP